MADCAVVGAAGDSGRLAVEPGHEPAIRLDRKVELEPISAAPTAIGGPLNRVGAIQIGDSERVDGNCHWFGFTSSMAHSKGNFSLRQRGTILPLSIVFR